MLVALDIGIGNIGSVTNVLKHLEYEFKVAKKPGDINEATKIIFPGVGSFSEGSKLLHENGFSEILKEKVIKEKTPILGICLGMQLLTELGSEGGESKGLGFIPGKVVPIKLEDESLNIPHMGWNSITNESNSLLYRNIQNESCFYFVHSYECNIQDNDVQINYTDYGRKIVASFSKENVYGTQFHPEKSQEVGLKLLRNFVELC